jgi:hypothetical protein
VSLADLLAAQVVIDSPPVFPEGVMATQRALVPSPLRPPLAFFLPATPEEYRAIHDHLERILASSVFRNSKRYSSVLKYIVERTIEGAGDQLKERTIGIEVFGRAPDYDTASDHAVRSAASEIRKRLAQYYQEEGDSRIKNRIAAGFLCTAVPLDTT